MADDMAVDNASRTSVADATRRAQGSATSESVANAARPDTQRAMAPAEVEGAANAQSVRGERGRTATGATTTAPSTSTAPAMPAAALATREPAPMTSEVQKSADVARERFRAADAADKKGDPRANEQRHAALRDATADAKKIADPAQRDAFVNSIASEAGKAAGQVILKNGGAVQSLQALGEQGSKETAQKLTRSATETAGVDKIVPLSSATSQVGAAARATLEAKQQKYADFARGFKDGVVDTAKGLAHTGVGAYKYATDPKTRDSVNKAASALREAIKTPEGQKQIGQALGAAGDQLVEAMKKNPAYAAGFVAGSVAAGGAVAKGLSALGKSAAAFQPVADAVKAAKAVASDPKTKVAVLGAAAVALDQPAVQKAIDDGLATAKHAPGSTVAAALAMATARGRQVIKAAMQHLRNAVDDVRNGARPPATQE